MTFILEAINIISGFDLNILFFSPQSDKFNTLVFRRFSPVVALASFTVSFAKAVWLN